MSIARRGLSELKHGRVSMLPPLATLEFVVIYFMQWQQALGLGGDSTVWCSARCHFLQSRHQRLCEGPAMAFAAVDYGFSVLHCRHQCL